MGLHTPFLPFKVHCSPNRQPDTTNSRHNSTVDDPFVHIFDDIHRNNIKCDIARIIEESNFGIDAAAKQISFDCHFIKMTTSVTDCPDQMAEVRLSEGIPLIFDKETPSSSTSPRSRSSSRSSNSRLSASPGRHYHSSRLSRRHRSASSSSSSSSRSRSRDRPLPRCHRSTASHQRCCQPRRQRYGHSHRQRSPPRHYRAHSRSYSPSPDRVSRRSRSRSSAVRRNERSVERSRYISSKSRSYLNRVARINRSRSRSSSSNGSPVHHTFDVAEDTMQVPEDTMQLTTVESQPSTPEDRVRPESSPEQCPSQNSDAEPEDDQNSNMSPKRQVISFRINTNGVKAPVVGRDSDADNKVTNRVIGITSLNPYGSWVPVGGRPTKSSRSHSANRF